MCRNLMDMELFEDNFFDEFEALSKDPIKNVRIMVAKTIQKHYLKEGIL